MIKVSSAAVIGIEAAAVDVEVDIRPGLPGFEIVGLAGQAVKESRERVRSALKNSGFNYPLQKIVVNLAPADLKKNGTLYDLPIALGILAGMGCISTEQLKRYVIVGELSLNGELRGVPGMISIAELAARNGKLLLIPEDNGPEAAEVTRRAYALKSLAMAYGLYPIISIFCQLSNQNFPQKTKPCTIPSSKAKPLPSGC